MDAGDEDTGLNPFLVRVGVGTLSKPGSAQ